MKVGHYQVIKTEHKETIDFKLRMIMGMNKVGKFTAENKRANEPQDLYQSSEGFHSVHRLRIMGANRDLFVVVPVTVDKIQVLK